MDGDPVPQKSLRIPLKDFLPNVLRSDFPPEALEREIAISYAKLAEYLDDADARYQLTKTRQGIQQPEIRKRRREETPPEELASEDERRFERAELAVERAVDEKDEDWKT